MTRGTAGHFVGLDALVGPLMSVHFGKADTELCAAVPAPATMLFPSSGQSGGLRPVSGSGNRKVLEDAEYPGRCQ